MQGAEVEGLAAPFRGFRNAVEALRRFAGIFRSDSRMIAEKPSLGRTRLPASREILRRSISCKPVKRVVFFCNHEGTSDCHGWSWD